MKYKVGNRIKIKDDFSCDKNYEVGTNKKNGEICRKNNDSKKN